MEMYGNHALEEEQMNMSEYVGSLNKPLSRKVIILNREAQLRSKKGYCLLRPDAGYHSINICTGCLIAFSAADRIDHMAGRSERKSDFCSGQSRQGWKDFSVL